MDKNSVRRNPHPSTYVERVEEDRGTKKQRMEPEVCKDCNGGGYQTNGFDGSPERCITCDGFGEV